MSCLKLKINDSRDELNPDPKVIDGFLDFSFPVPVSHTASTLSNESAPTDQIRSSCHTDTDINETLFTTRVPIIHLTVQNYFDRFN